MKRQCRDVTKHPFDKQKRQVYIKTRNEYKRTCRNAEQKCRRELTKKLLNIGLNDPKGFWNIIKQMNNWGKEKEDETDQIKPSTWKEYFTKLLNENEENADISTDDNLPGFVPTFNPILHTPVLLPPLILDQGKILSSRRSRHI